MEEEWSNKGNLGIIGYPYGEIAISPNLEGRIVSTSEFFSVNTFMLEIVFRRIRNHME